MTPEEVKEIMSIDEIKTVLLLLGFVENMNEAGHISYDRGEEYFQLLRVFAYYTPNKITVSQQISYEDMEDFFETFK